MVCDAELGKGSGTVKARMEPGLWLGLGLKEVLKPELRLCLGLPLGLGLG